MIQAQGYPRADGRFGIRNHLLVLYTVECVRVVAQRIASQAGARLAGFPGCYANPPGQTTLLRLGTHPNVGAVLIVALGCEHTDYRGLRDAVAVSGRPVELLVMQQTGGGLRCLEAGVRLTAAMRQHLARQRATPVGADGLVVGVECGGSDATSGLIANPAVGVAAEAVVDAGGAVLAEEITEMLGCAADLSRQAASEAISCRLADRIDKARRYSNLRQSFAISPGNVSGGLTTIEEKSLGAVFKLGSRPIRGVLQPGEVVPRAAGVYVLDRVPNPDSRLVCTCGGGDATGVTDLAAAGAQVVLFTTGQGTPVGNAIVPVIKVCGNPETCTLLADHVDVPLDGYFSGILDRAQAGERVLQRLRMTLEGTPTQAELWGHEEYWIDYKY